MTELELPQIPGILVESVAGAGGMGVVMRARLEADGTPIALKLLTGLGAEAIARFGREVEVLRRIEHDAVVRLLGHGRAQDGRPWIALEWLDGEDLECRLRRGPLDEGAACALVARLAEGLAAVHERGVVHRDVKPSNVFLPGGDPWRAKLLDFGIARPLERLVFQTLDPQQVIGTPGYMAPEQIRGGEVDARADLFSLGCVLFECITGRSVFTGRHAMALMSKVLLEPAPQLRELSPSSPRWLDALVGSLLDKDPGRRPRDAGVLARALQPSAQTQQVAASATSIPPHASLGWSERRLSVVLLFDPPAIALAVMPTEPSGRGDAAELIRAHGGRAEPMLEGSLVAVFEESSGSVEAPLRAAACALVLEEVAPDARIAIALARTDPDRPRPFGPAVDRAASLLGATEGIAVDEDLARLLEARFELTEGERSARLRSRRATVGARPVSGKALPCVGREVELATLRATMQLSASEGVARIALVTAPSGVGKSRLLFELLESSGPAAVWRTAGDPTRVASPLGVIADLVRSSLGLPADADGAAIDAAAASRLGPSVPWAGQVMRELLGAPLSAEEAGAELRSARRDPAILGDLVTQIVESLVAAACAEAPLCVAVDDLQWADAASARVLASVFRAEEERPLLLLLLGRPEVTTAFPALVGADGVQHLALPGLSRRAARRLVESVLGTDARARVDAVVDRADGNAFFLEELMRAEVAARPVPDTVFTTVERRLAALGAAARRVLRVASVLGPTFAVGGLCAVMDEDPSAVRHTLASLEAAEVLVAQGHQVWAFRHALVREAAYAALTASDVTGVHRAVAAWLGAQPAPDPGLVAHHLSAAGDEAEAAPWLIESASAALLAGDFASASATAVRVLAGEVMGELRARAALVDAEARWWLIDTTGARTRADEARSLSRVGDETWCRACGVLALVCVRQVDRAGLRALTADVLPIVERAGTAPGYVQILGGRSAVALAYAREPELALRFVEAVEARALQGEPLVGSYLASTRATLALHHGDLGIYVEQIAAGVAASRAAGDVRRTLTSRSNLAFGYGQLGAFEEAAAILEDVATECARLGITSQRIVARQNLGWMWARLGRRAEARAMLEEVLAHAVDSHDTRLVGGTENYLALLALEEGEVDRAVDLARSAAERLASSPLGAYAMATQAAALVARGEDARAVARAACELFDSSSGEQGESLARLALAEACQRHGSPEDAAEAWRSAHASLLARAACITEPRWREAFLERVPENARVVAAMQATQAQAPRA